MRYYCRVCDTIFVNNTQVKDNVYTVADEKNNVRNFHFNCINKFKSDDHFEIPKDQLDRHTLGVFK